MKVRFASRPAWLPRHDVWRSLALAASTAFAELSSKSISIKALSVYQPWATFIALGAERVKARLWPTTYRE